MSAVSVGMFVVLGTGAPAFADPPNVTVLVEPQLIQAGGTIKITVNNCGKNKGASAESGAFPKAAVTTSAGGNAVTANIVIPTTSVQGTYPIKVKCDDSSIEALQSLYVYQPAPTPNPSRGGPPTGGGGTAAGSGMVLTAAGVGIAGLGGMVGVLAWRRRNAIV